MTAISLRSPADRACGGRGVQGRKRQRTPRRHPATYALRAGSRALLAASRSTLASCSQVAAGGDRWLVTAVRGHLGDTPVMRRPGARCSGAVARPSVSRLLDHQLGSSSAVTPWSVCARRRDDGVSVSDRDPYWLTSRSGTQRARARPRLKRSLRAVHESRSRPDAVGACKGVQQEIQNHDQSEEREDDPDPPGRS